MTFIGGVYGNWVPLIRALKPHVVRIWGYINDPSLADCFRDEPVYGLKKTKIYVASKIVLNIQDEEKQVNAISNRIPETLACGGFILTDWRPDIELSGLKDGCSVACYRNESDLKDKITYYLANPDERRKIAERGRVIVLRSMTYDVVGACLATQMESLLKERA